MRFFTEAIDKSIHDAISSYNEAFVDAFHNAMEETVHGILVGQVGSTCYNIPNPSTQGTNQVDTSHQEVVPAGNGDVQTLQGSSEQTPGTTTIQIQYNPRPSIQHVQQLTGQSQNQMINFGTSGHIPSSAQKIAPSIQRIRGDIDPYVYNQRFQPASQQKTQQIEIPQGYHYSTDYNTLHMMPNPGYQGTWNFNP
jgi:hypothetical protein